ncbi:hypothetical protein U8335_27060 [Roseiconus lacunae]|uniref:hypothetical protein n=1 Tax=Roseiconus lacunae TaxID=2605694 RepID=UPI003090D71B|nr:hypothetical protein U8335_27060 [Stieleria sp. HD01]
MYQPDNRSLCLSNASNFDAATGNCLPPNTIPAGVSGFVGQAPRWHQRLKFTLGMLGGLLPISLGALPVVAGTPCDIHGPGCGVDVCDSCDGAPEWFAAASQCDDAGCDAIGQGQRRKPHNPLYGALDAVAGGIEKTLGLDRCKSKRACSCGSCGTGSHLHTLPFDAMHAIPAVPGSIEPLMPRSRHQPTQPRDATTPSLPSVPADESIELDPSGLGHPSQPPTAPVPPKSELLPDPKSPANPTTPERQLPPARETSPALPMPAQPTPSDVMPSEAFPSEPMPRDAAPASPFQDDVQPMPQPSDDLDNIFDDTESPMPQPTPRNTPPAQKSPFDILDEELDQLDDPFKEDANSLRQPYQPIRPTGVRASSYRRSRPSQPVGSGLRPVSGPALLQPVNHEEPIGGLAPLGGGGKLVPYRAKR